MENTTITAIPGLLAGHATDAENRTGCTAILCPEGMTPGIAVPGSAPGTRESDLMRPQAIAEEIHGIMLCGGSAFGLAACDGLMRFLREKGHGVAMPHARIPLVSGAVIYDLDMNRKAGQLPDAAMGYAAAVAASSAPVIQGSVGAGAGARCGRLFSLGTGPDYTAKAGLGSALMEYRGVLVGALVVVNALGNVYDPESGELLAGARDRDGRPFSREAMLAALAGEDTPRANTVLSVVAVNVPLGKVQTSRLAAMAGAGLARAVFPAHLCFDGDVVFALSAKSAPEHAGPWTENLLGALGAMAVARAAANAAVFA